MWFLSGTDHPTSAVHENVFSKEECEKIIEYGLQSEISNSLINSSVEDTKIRNGKCSWLSPSKEHEWIYRRLVDSITFMNTELWQFDLLYLETLQFTIYENKGHRYKQHLDILKSKASDYRKLSFSLQLSEDISYKGSNLLIYNGDNVIKPASRIQGNINYFPSYILHEVTPLLEGNRYCLVGWVCGPKFK